MNEHLLKRFDEELNKLRYRLIKMGTLVQQQIELSISSVLNKNDEHAKLVIKLEDKVDMLDIKIDKQCLKIFALHQPVAMDLRLVLSAVSINDNMELMGDLATNIAKNSLKINIPIGLLDKIKLKEMCDLLNSITAKSLDSFVYMNNELAIEVIKKDLEISQLFKNNFALLIDIMKEDTSLIEVCSYLLDINKNIQSISRQIKSIAQELIFLYESKMIKHRHIEDFKLIDAELHFDKNSEDN